MLCGPASFWTPLLALAVCTLTGCGGGDPLGRRAVSGTVTFQNKPLDQGAIRFEPTDLEKGVGGGGAIEGGRYRIGEEMGLPPGKYKVWITSPDSVAEAPVGEAPGETPRTLARERIPPKYNIKTELEAEVPTEGEAELNFDLK